MSNLVLFYRCSGAHDVCSSSNLMCVYLLHTPLKTLLISIGPVPMGSMDGGAADGSRDVAGEEKKEKEREREMREREGRLRRWGETLQVRLRFENSVLCLFVCLSVVANVYTDLYHSLGNRQCDLRHTHDT